MAEIDECPDVESRKDVTSSEDVNSYAEPPTAPRPIPPSLQVEITKVGLPLDKLCATENDLATYMRETYPITRNTIVKKTPLYKNGLFATTRIERNCPVFAEKCVVSIPWYIMLSTAAMTEFKPEEGFPEQLMTAAEWRLLSKMLMTGKEEDLRHNYCKTNKAFTCAGADQFIKWWNDHPKRKEYGGKALTEKSVLSLVAKVWTNEFKLGISPLSYFYRVGLAPTVAKINHACLPNCKIACFGDTVVLMALRDIDVGEELTRSYTMFAGDAYLGNWDVCVTNSFIHVERFKCLCATCHEGPTGSCRNRIELLDTLSDKLNNATVMKAIKFVELFFDHGKMDERLDKRTDDKLDDGEPKMADLVDGQWRDAEKRMKLGIIARYLHFIYEAAVQKIPKDKTILTTLVEHASYLDKVLHIEERCGPDLRLVQDELIALRLIEFIITEKNAAGDIEEWFLSVCWNEVGIVRTLEVVHGMADLTPDYALGLSRVLEWYT